MSDYFNNGGPMMWPLLTLSVLTLVVTLEKLTRFFLFKRKCDKRLRAEFVTLAENDGLTKAASNDRFSNDHITNQVLLNSSSPFMVNKIEMALQEKLNKLNSFSRVYDFIIYLAPICGILGTVIGVIVSFDIAGEMNLMDPSLAMKGIAQAFISTAAGLIIAVLAYIPSSIFESLIIKETNQLNNFLTMIKNTAQE